MASHWPQHGEPSTRQTPCTIRQSKGPGTATGLDSLLRSSAHSQHCERSSLQETASTDSHSVWASVPNKPSTDAKCVRNPFGCMDLRRELGEETGGAADASGIYHRDEGRSGERLSETECRP